MLPNGVHPALSPNIASPKAPTYLAAYQVGQRRMGSRGTNPSGERQGARQWVGHKDGLLCGRVNGQWLGCDYQLATAQLAALAGL